MPSFAFPLWFSLSVAAVQTPSLDTATDSSGKASSALEVLQQGKAGWDLGRNQIHIVSWPNLGGGYPAQEHLVLDARQGKRLRTLPGLEVDDGSEISTDSLQAIRLRAVSGFPRKGLQTTGPVDSLHATDPSREAALEGRHDGNCLRIQLAKPILLSVSAWCCGFPEGSKKACLLPANDWAFWPAPQGHSGLLRAQVNQLANECNAGPVYSLQRWTETTCKGATPSTSP